MIYRNTEIIHNVYTVKYLLLDKLIIFIILLLFLIHSQTVCNNGV
jgi:hypothetical protein